MNGTDRRDPRRDAARGAGAYLGYGLTWALSTVLFLLLGQWVDGRFGTTPAFTLIGAFVGAAAGFYYMYRHLVSGPRGGSGDAGRR